MPRGLVVVGLIAIGTVAVGAVRNEDSPSARQGAERRLVLDEDFRGSRLNRRRWNTCHWWADRGCTIASNNELEWYLPGQVRLSRGKLRLVAERREVRGSDGRLYPYASGMISSGPRPGSTRPKFAFRYGRAEIRARVPKGTGLWSAFWLLPANRESKPEIDVMEIIGQRPATVEMHLHFRGPDGEVEQRGNEWRGRRLRRGWHTFAIDWRPRRLAWLIDGKVRWRVRGNVVPRTRMYLVANLAVGGDWPGPPDASTRFPSALAIDYVKVWR